MKRIEEWPIHASEENDDKSSIVKELISDEDDDDVYGVVNRNEMTENIIDNNNTKEQLMKERDRKLKEQQDELRKNEKMRKLSVVPLAIWNFLVSLFRINTYVILIQSFEDLLMTLFVNTLLIGVIFSLGFITYIIINGYGDLKLLIFKLIGAICISVICLIAQANLPNPYDRDKNKKDEEM